MKKEEKWTPHIIAAGAFAVFVVLGLACASSSNAASETPPKLFETRQSTVNMPDIGRVQYQEMLVYVDDYGMQYSLGKTAIPGAEGLFGYTINISALGTNLLRAHRQEIANARATPGSLGLYKRYAVRGPVVITVDGVTYSLDDYSEITMDTYIVYSISAGLGDARNAILNCSQSRIGGDISPDGIIAIKEFIKLTPEEAVLDALQSL